MGSYNASTGTWTKGADYSLTETSRNTYNVTGEIPYGEADAIFPTAGNRFAVRIAKKGITSKTQLPSGPIVKTTNTEAAGGYNKATKSAFEDDGSLIAIFAPTAETKNAYNREVKIEWEGDGVYVTYTFNLTNATLESAPQPAGLTEIQVNDDISTFKVDNTMNVSSVKAVLEQLTYEEGSAILLQDDESNNLLMAQKSTSDIDESQFAYSIVAAGGGMPIWISEPTSGVETAGWITSIEVSEFDPITIVQQDGTVAIGAILAMFGMEMDLVVATINQGSIWNGIVVGK